jgi:molecular chaperone GrpE (heat shock protein)
VIPLGAAAPCPSRAAQEDEQVVKKVQKAPALRKASEKPAPTKAPKPTPTRTATAQPAPAPVTRPVTAAASRADRTLDGAVDSLRRLLSELLEQRLEAVARDLADVRRVLTSGAESDTVLDRIDDLLDQVGAVRFAAEPLDVVDPLIHTVVDERPGNGAPRGVVLEGVRPGFRSARGLVLAKAAVAVSAG